MLNECLQESRKKLIENGEDPEQDNVDCLRWYAENSDGYFKSSFALIVKD